MPHAGPAAASIRVVLAGVPGLTAGLIRRYLAGQSDIVIVQELRHAEDLDDLPDRQSIDVVVTARPGGDVPLPCQRLLFGPSGVPVIAIGSDGRLEIYNCRFVREAELDELLAEIRRIAARDVETGQR
jgi:hypothetical protein